MQGPNACNVRHSALPLQIPVMSHRSCKTPEHVRWHGMVCTIGDARAEQRSMEKHTVHNLK